MVSDRAKALVQLGKPQYLGICSMPDLFHFKQLLAKQAGALIGKAWSKSKQALEQIKASGVFYSQRKPYEDAFLFQDVCKLKYRTAMDAIHKAIHPFDEEGQLKQKKEIDRPIRQSIQEVEWQLIRSKAATKADNIGTTLLEYQKVTDGLKIETILKLHSQLPDILQAVHQWQQWTIERVTNFVNVWYSNYDKSKEVPAKTEFENYLLHYLIPWTYWQNIVRRTPTNPTNKALLKTYHNLVSRSAVKYLEHPITKRLDTTQIQTLQQWANQVANSFQRSSSQVEGRNGYLAFVHKANRGMPDQRLQVLTVVHNFDIRRVDGTTPAQRLFQQDFPDLFEFVLENVTGFYEPRKTKPKRLITNLVRA